MKTLISSSKRASIISADFVSTISRWVAASAAGFLIASAHASPLFQEGFDYTSGTTLAGNGAWVNSASLITVGNGSLSYSAFPDVFPEGNEARITGQSASSQSYTYAPFDSSASSGTVYASFLLSFSVAGGNYTFMGLLPSAGNGGTFNNTLDPCDLSSIGATGGYKLGIRTLGQSAGYTTAPVLPLNTPNLVVIKYDFTAHAASLFINPALDGNEPGSAISVSTGTASAVDLGQIYLRIGGANQGNYLVDDIRIGTTWGDVVPVPEPSAFALLGLALFALRSGRRARHQ